MPIHQTKGKTLAQCIADRTNYALNPEKTNSGELVSAYACDPRSFASEVILSKRQYRHFTGKEEKNEILIYQVRQSFKPGEVSPEEANQIGYDFASRFLKGKHAFYVCTHTDKAISIITFIGTLRLLTISINSAISEIPVKP